MIPKLSVFTTLKNEKCVIVFSHIDILTWAYELCIIALHNFSPSDKNIDQKYRKKILWHLNMFAVFSPFSERRIDTLPNTG